LLGALFFAARTSVVRPVSAQLAPCVDSPIERMSILRELQDIALCESRGSRRMTTMNRRTLFSMIGAAAGSTVMYNSMASLGFVQASSYKGPIKLDGDPKGTSVLILGAGVAGMTAALELRDAGYKVQILEYNNRAGGRSWSLRGGDTYTELGGAVQHCEFDEGLYLNPGPWRIPYHHTALLAYCRRLDVALEPFIQVNYNAYIHSSQHFGGKPKRFREVQADFHGHVAELLAKSAQQAKLDQAVTKEDAEVLMEALKHWGALDETYSYRESLQVSERRGYQKPPGGGLSGAPVASQPIELGDLLNSGLWQTLNSGHMYDWQSSIFQPVGGMGMIGKGFEKEVGNLIRYNAKVTAIHQDDHGVSVSYIDAKKGGTTQVAKADWCLCTIPLSVLSQIEVNVGAPMAAAINAVPYASAVKTGLQFKRRFWEQDESIYGGITFTDLPICQISYPSTRFGHPGKGVLLGSFTAAVNGVGFNDTAAFSFTAMSPADRVKKAVEYGALIHPQYHEEFENGVSVAWHRVPSHLGCFGAWTDETRAQHFKNLCAIDGRILLAGEHASDLPGWQEGGVLSALDAITRLHQRVVTA
jgi:monoamine oxidase